MIFGLVVNRLRCSFLWCKDSTGDLRTVDFFLFWLNCCYILGFNFQPLPCYSSLFPLFFILFFCLGISCFNRMSCLEKSSWIKILLPLKLILLLRIRFLFVYKLNFINIEFYLLESWSFFFPNLKRSSLSI